MIHSGWEVHLDTYTLQEGLEVGVIEALNNTEALLRTSRLIEERRWIRIHLQAGPMDFLLVARASRRENQLAVTPPDRLTRYRYLIEWTMPLSSVLEELARNHGLYQTQINEPLKCAQCGLDHPSVPLLDLIDSNGPYKNGAPLKSESPVPLLCLPCHLRRSAGRLLNPAAMPSSKSEPWITSLS